jgi:hypothetical protein
MDSLFVYNMSEKCKVWTFEPVVKATIRRSATRKPNLTAEEQEKMVITLVRMLIEVAIAETWIIGWPDNMDIEALRESCQTSGVFWKMISNKTCRAYAEIVKKCVDKGLLQTNTCINFHKAIWAKLCQLESASCSTEAQK